MSDSDREIYKDSTINQKSLRTQIVKEFDRQLRELRPSFKKGSGRFWTAPLDSDNRFYVTFVFPKYQFGDSRLEVAYHIEPRHYAPAEQEDFTGQKTVTYPYDIHHQLFEFPHTPWCKSQVGYLYWKLLMQKKKLYYYTPEQTKYSLEILVPHAISRILKDYDRALSKRTK
jgi:hypothetical protein